MLRETVLIVTFALLPFTFAVDQATVCSPLLQSEGVLLQCKSPEGKDVSCRESAIPYTEAKFTCRPHYESVRKHLSMTCGPNGRWYPYRSFECAIECGKQDWSVQPLVVGGYGANITQWPWHVAIFRKSSTRQNDFDYICGGSIISSSSILSAAHCFKAVDDVSDYRLVLAPVSSNFRENVRRSSNNESVKIMTVRSLENHPRFNRHNFEGDLALLQPSHRMKFGDHIRPVCYTFKQTSRPSPSTYIPTGTFGHVVGFGKTATLSVSKYLMETKLPVVSTEACKQEVGRTHGSSQYCAGYTNGTATCSGDSGGGMYFPIEPDTDQRFVVGGLVSHSLKGRCDTYTVFTHVSSFLPWIETVESVFSSTIPEPKNEELFCQAPEFLHNENRFLPLLNQSTKVQCFKDSTMKRQVECNLTKPGAIAQLSCQTAYMENLDMSSKESFKSKIRCSQHGKWEATDFECEPECGKVSPLAPGHSAIIQGNSLPWHVRIYNFQKVTKGDIVQHYIPPKFLLCGGTLVETNVVITAADCVTDQAGVLLSTSGLFVVLGTNSSAVNIAQKDPTIQYRRVEKMWIHNSFDKNELTSNIAVLQLDHPAELRDNVKRACYLKKMPAFDHPDVLSQSPHFQHTLQFEDFDHARFFITSPSKACVENGVRLKEGTICANANRNSVVCRNDSGHGLLQNLQGVEVLRGVLTYSGNTTSQESCFVNEFVAYTDLETFGVWILDIINTIGILA